MTFHPNQLILKLLDSESDAILLVYSQGLTHLPFPLDSPMLENFRERPDGPDYFLNPRKKDADQDQIEEKLIPVKVTVPDEPVRKFSPLNHIHVTYHRSHKCIF